MSAVIQNPHILDADALRELSGKHTASAVRKWAKARGLKVLEGDKGPFTTIEAVNLALGVGSANDPQYKPEDIA